MNIFFLLGVVILLLLICSSRQRKFRFWLSRLIFEKIGKRDPAQKKGEQIAKEVKEYDEKYSSYCDNCGKSEFTKDIRGSEGLFTNTTTVYRCKKCGNVQEESGRSKYRFRELEEVRIVEDGDDQYRYTILTYMQWGFVWILGMLGFAILIVVLINKSCQF